MISCAGAATVKTVGSVTRAGRVRVPIESARTVGAVGTPSSVTSATGLPVAFSMIRSTSVEVMVSAIVFETRARQEKWKSAKNRRLVDMLMVL